MGARTEADLILTGGRVFLSKGAFASAVAVVSDRVVAAGDDTEAAVWRGPRTRVVELKGRLVVPGFNDAHVHFLDGGHALLSVDLRPARDEADFVDRVAAYARTRPEGTWILGGHWDHEAWPGKSLPTRGRIDTATESHPIFVSRLDGHMGLANSRALRLAGITRETPDPPGGSLVRDSTGEPTGILKDNAQTLVQAVIPPPSREMNRRATRAALALARRYGVTSLQDNSCVDALPTYLDLREAGELTARFSVWRYADTLSGLRSGGIRTGLGDEWVRLGPIKILADGSMGASTAAFLEPYDDDPGTSGLLLYEKEELERLVLEADSAGFQLAVHAIGDRAARLVLDAFEKARRPGTDQRFRMEHAQVVRPDDLPRFRDLGVIASVQPSHLLDDMRWATSRIGAGRCQDAYRLGSFLRAGVEVALGTDWPVESLDPRIGVYAAVAREFPEGGPPGGWSPAERVTVEEAIDLYTRGSAFAEGSEGRKGTLLPGALADLVVFGGDLLSMPPREILQTPVEMTVVGGRVVYEP